MGCHLSQASTTESGLKCKNLATEGNNNLLVYGFIRDISKELANIHIFTFIYATVNQR